MIMIMDTKSLSHANVTEQTSKIIFIFIIKKYFFLINNTLAYAEHIIADERRSGNFISF
jgi:hypothetical protein